MRNITLNVVLGLFLAKLKWLLVGIVGGAVLLGAYTALFVDDEYTASVSLYVQNAEEENGVTTNNLYASAMLTNSYVVILQDVETLKLAAENMTVPATLGQISRALSITTSEDAAIIIISAKTSDALLSQSICQAVADAAPEMAREIVGSGSITALGDVPPAVKTRPNMVKNALLGAVGGFLVVAVILLVRHLTDTTIRSKEDLSQLTDLPLLGEIPALQTN